MTVEKMRQALINFYDEAGQMQLVEQFKAMESAEIEKHYKRMIEEEVYDQARIKLDEETVQKEFDLDKGRGKLK